MSRHVAARDVTLAILAGGQGTRAGGRDKGLVEWHSRPLIEHVLANVPDGLRVIVSANRNIERYARYGHPVVADAADGFRGPLAGISRVLDAMSTPWLVTAPVDVPHWPAGLLDALLAGDEPVVVAHDGSRRQVLFARYWGLLADNARAALASGDLAVWAFQDRCGAREARIGEPGAFRNLNELPDTLE